MKLAEVKNLDGGTALHVAAFEFRCEATKCLLKVGGVTLAEIKKQNVGSFEETALHLAAKFGHSEVAECLLEVGGVRLAEMKNEAQNCRGCGETALHWAAHEGHFEVAERLLKVGGMILTEIKNDDGQTARDIATNRGHVNIVEYIDGEGWVEAAKLERRAASAA